MKENAATFSKSTDIYEDASYWRSDEDVITKKIKAGSKLLIGGIGAGRTYPYLKERGHTITAVDISPAMVAITHKKFPEMDVRVMDLQKTTFTENEFDAIFLPFHTIAYVDDLKTTLLEMKRILKPEGVLIFSIPNQFYIKRAREGFPHIAMVPIKRGSAEKLRTITASYFNVNEFKKIFTNCEVFSRARLQDVKNPHWKEKLLQMIPFFDKTLYFVCHK